MTYTIQHNVSLKSYTTFGVEALAKRFVRVTTEAQLLSVLKDFKYQKILFLGGGSNILFTRDVEDEVAVHIDLKGIDIIEDRADALKIRVSAGENWHEFVLWSLRIGLSGIENLSLIPGNVGTSPIQNIGAYGVEVKDLIVSVKAVDRTTDQIVFLNNKDCAFGYRDSLFKQDKKRYVITAVVFELSKVHSVNTSYGAIKNVLKEKGITDPTPKQVSDVIVEIRSAKLPNPQEIGNAGSFFKNPVITNEQLKVSSEQFGGEVPSYPVDEDRVKVPAGWLIEQCGWKGKTFETYGVHKDQALVLVNHGGAKGEDIWKLAQNIQTSVYDRFGIMLEPEVNIY